MRQRSDLRSYQERVADFLFERHEALAVLRMGAGKTSSALTAIVDLLDAGEIRHALVVAPLRVARYVWPAEIAAWEHTRDLRYEVLDGSPGQRCTQLASAAQRQLTIIGIDLLQWLCDELKEVGPANRLFDLLVIDEASRLRSATGKRAQALAKLAPRWKNVWGLTGTLRPSSAQDLFMPARVITRGKLWGRSFYRWRVEHFQPLDYKGYRWGVLPGHEELLNAQIAPLIVTLAPDEMPQLPALNVIVDTVRLPEHARRAYNLMETKLMAKLGDKDILAASMGVATGKLAQIANGFLYDDSDEEAPDRRTVRIHNVKDEWLYELIKDADGQMLLIYEFQEDRDMIRRVLSSAPDVSSWGELGAGDAKQDAMLIEYWNDRKLPFLVMHPASGGHGLNLQQGGSQMAWVSPTWGSELWEQTLARLHRPGQEEAVMVRVCVAEDTVDGLKLDRVHRKMSAQDAFEKYLSQRQLRLGEAAE